MTPDLFGLSTKYAPKASTTKDTTTNTDNKTSKDTATNGTSFPINEQYQGTNGTLDMTDFLMLMVEQFKNQTIDNTASTSDMMNQLVQMSVMQAVNDVTDSLKVVVDANTLSYAGSLVGKEVTVGEFDKKGKLVEIVGTVTGTGTLEGQQVIFINDDAYFLNQIMAVGRLPKVPEDDKDKGDGENNDSGDNAGGDKVDTDK